MTAVIACPHCIRAYRIESELNGKLVRCEACGCHFGVNIVVPALPGEALPLESPLQVHYNFLREAAEAMARNVESICRLAGEPFTAESLVKFVRSLPLARDEIKEGGWRGGYADVVMREAHRRSTYDDRASLTRLLDYFIGRVPDRSTGANEQLVAAFAGVLSVGFDRPTGTEVALYRRPGPLERWAARRGW